MVSCNIGYCVSLLAVLWAIAEAMSSSATQHNALVIYEESAILPHHRPYKNFQFGQHAISIKQNWAGDGVAGVVWDAAVTLCEYIISKPSIVKGRRILELGAGTGLAGICAYMEGADVTLTDRQATITILEENVLQNKQKTSGFCSDTGDIGSASCRGEHSSEDNKHSIHGEDNSKSVPVSEGTTKRESSMQVKVLDWSSRVNPLFNEYWDLVIGADIIYIESTFDDLLRSMQLLKYSLLILSCRLRYAKDHKFIKRAKEHFEVNLILYDKSRDVTMYSFKVREIKS